VWIQPSVCSWGTVFFFLGGFHGLETISWRFHHVEGELVRGGGERARAGERDLWDERDCERFRKSEAVVGDGVGWREGAERPRVR
jgi:hypothetical protein